ncbi:hotdog family protein [Sphingomonas canadensis]
MFWDDLTSGDWIRTMGRTVTETDLVQFCNLTWLTEELFTNIADSEHRAIKGRVVPGALVYSFAEGLMLPFMQRTGLAFLEAGLNVHAPTFVGDTIHVECEVAELRPASSPERGLSRTRNHVINDRGETVMTYSPLRLMRRRARSTGR